MRSAAMILTLGVLAWAALPGQAAEKKGLLKLCSGCCGTPAKTVECAPKEACVHTTCCPKPAETCESCKQSVCLGTTTKCRPSGGKLVQWLTYRPQSNCCGKGIQVQPCRYPPLTAWFAHRCCDCTHAGVVDTPCCDAGCTGECSSCKGCAGKPEAKPCAVAKTPGPLKSAAKKLVKKDQFASDVAQPVSYQAGEQAAPAVVPARK